MPRKITIQVPTGTCDAELKTKLPSEAVDLIAGLAALRGQTKSEYLRDLIMAHLYGRAHIVRLQHATSSGGALWGPAEGGE